MYSKLASQEMEFFMQISTAPITGSSWHHYIDAYLTLIFCVCVCEREKERERGGGERERDCSRKPITKVSQ